MKKLSKIRLNQFSNAELEQRKMNALRGGDSCACVTCYCAGSASIGMNTASGPQVQNAVHSSDGKSYY